MKEFVVESGDSVRSAIYSVASSSILVGTKAGQNTKMWKQNRPERTINIKSPSPFYGEGTTEYPKQVSTV